MLKIKKYKILIFIVILIIIASILSIGNNKTEKIYQLNDEVKLYRKEKAKIKDLTIKLLSISNSTCPKNAQCIWAGEYSYKLLINGKRITLGTVKAKEYNYKNYKIVLLDKTSKEYILFKVSKEK